MPRQQSKTFTEKELEIMRVLWQRGEATVRDIQQALGPERHYNSVLTIIRVLERKGHIAHRQEGRGFVYRPIAPQQESKSRVLAQVIEDVFGGSTKSMVLNLVEAGNITLDELDEIRKKVRKRVQR